MCSYQNINSVSHDNLRFNNWEEVFWSNGVAPNYNASNTSNCKHPATPVTETVSEENVVTTTAPHDCQMHVPTVYPNVESSSLLSPSWDDSSSTFGIPQNSITMSTYFSSFNPSSQFAETPRHQIPVTKNIRMAGEKEIHCARISLVASKNGTLKAVVKRKRKRTTFTTEQLEVLEEVFSKKPYVTRDDRQLLVKQLQVNDKSIKVWFQNRRLKNKRVDDEEVTQVGKNEIFERLDSVESKINERTDEFGYVTLDDKIMTDLVNVIDDYFANIVSPVEIKTEIDNSPIYEPISPVSTTDHSCDENVTLWQHYEPNETVQELQDIESFMSI